MAKTFREYAPEQMLLFPPSLREWLPQDHAVYFVGDLVEAIWRRFRPPTRKSGAILRTLRTRRAPWR